MPSLSGPPERWALSFARAILKSPDRGRVLFAVALEKTDRMWGEAAVERAPEKICKRFDTRLQRKLRQFANPQRGLLVFSEGRFDARARIWVRGFRERGTRWEAITNLADIPYFASMKESRLVQAADYVAHGVWHLYEKRDPSMIGPLIRCFDAQGTFSMASATCGLTRRPRATARRARAATHLVKSAVGFSPANWTFVTYVFCAIGYWAHPSFW